MINFSIPDFWDLNCLNMSLINLMEKEPKKFFNDIKITSIFGSFPCIWAGGRLSQGDINENKIYEIISFYNSHNIAIRNTFTNLLFHSPQEYDSIGNMICSICVELGEQFHIQNGCTINNDDLAKYITKQYPQLQIIYSTTKELSNIEDINKYSQSNLLIPSYNINHNFNILTQIQNPQNIELLCIEDGCPPYCKARHQHQICVSKANQKLNFDQDKDFICPHRVTKEPTWWYNNYCNPKIYININEIREQYLPLGFNQFKISGRGFEIISLINNIESYIHFFVQPEYKDEIRNKLLILSLKDSYAIK